MDKLDLHGVRHADVFREVDKFVGFHIMRGTPEIQIVTGHSDEMKYLVNDVLSDYGLVGLEGAINKGALTVYLL